MKKRLLLSLLALTYLLSFPVWVYAQSTCAPINGLIAQYSFNEAQGISTQDATGQLGPGVLTGGSLQANGGMDGGGIVALAGANYLDIPLNWTPTSFTFSFWLKPTRLYNYGQITGAKSGWGGFLFQSTASGGLYVGTDTRTRIALPNSAAVQAGTWQQFTFTFDNGVGIIYKNGQPIAPAAIMTMPVSWQGIRLGANGDAYYDELRVYNRALSALEVRNLYSCTPAATYLPPANPSRNTERNWTLERTYDGNEKVVAESKQFTDALGRPTQTQARNAATKQVFAAQTIYNTGGQAVLQTLAAPTNNQEFNYKEGFVTASGTAYGPANFEQGKTNAPDAVDATTPGTLGYYYSAQNAQEPLTPITGHPYSLTDFYDGPLGGVRRAASPGDEFRMGKGREAKEREFPLRGEFDGYLRLRPGFVPGSPLTTLEYQGTKSVSLNADGRESVVVTNKEGQAIISCLSGPQYPAVPVFGFISAEVNGPSGPLTPAYQDIHIPAAGAQDVKFTMYRTATAGGRIRIVNLLTDATTDYTIAPKTDGTEPEFHVTLEPGFYRFISLSGTQWSYYQARYGNFTYTYYDDAGRVVATVAPKDLASTTTQPLYTTRNSYDTSGRLLTTESNDEGRSEYVYARDGRIRFSQSALQRPAGRFSYSNYDAVGRVVESGEYTPGASGTVGAEFEGHGNYGAKQVGESQLLEAEDGDFMDNNGSRPYYLGAASNGYEVAFLQSVGNYVEVTAPLAAGLGGNYELQLRYSNGMGNPRTIALLVNGVRLQQVSFAPTAAWDVFATVRLTVPLTGGITNKIRLEYTSADNGNMNFDYVRVTPLLMQEAEEAVFVDSNGSKPAGSAGASGGRQVGYLTSVGNYVEFNLTTPAGQTGVYELQLGYSNGTGNTRTMNLKVNGSSVRQLSFLPTDNWDTFSTLHTTATLQGGTTNRVRVEFTSADLGYVNLDCLRAVAPVSATAKQEAEDAAFVNTNNNQASSVSTASGGKDVGFLTTVGTNVTFALTAPRAGTYTLRLRYATGGTDTRTMSLLVNESPATQLALPGTGGWSQFATLTTTATLRAGVNTLKVLYGAGDLGWADLDYLQADGLLAPLAHDQSVHDIVEDRTRTGGLALANCSQRNQVWYDLSWDGSDVASQNDSQLNGRKQQFVLGAVSKTKNDNVTTWYSYDELGRVTWVVQDIVGIGVKTLDYQYDFSGNVLQVVYQKNQTDSFYHYYTYDAAQRLAQVYTSTDGIAQTLQADYSYYLHGPLKRVQLASSLQGVDYTYTLQGALKNINHVNQTLEPGHDSPKNNGVYKDLFALTLDYFSGDYRSRNLDAPLPVAGGPSVPTRYDGTIQGATWRTAANNTIHRVAYAYDEKSQLENSTYGKWEPQGASGSYLLNAASTKTLREGGMSYDPNGNILALQRTGLTDAPTDNFSYTYKPNTNQLKEVHTGNATGITVFDYDYDELGQMTRQRDEQGQRYFTYDVTGKTSGVYLDAARQQPLVTYAYDDRGFRVSKTLYATGTTTPTRTTYYVRDVAGNALAVYEKPTATGALQRSEVPLYGASRLGTLTRLEDASDDYRYELDDHLGDARVVFHRPLTDVGTETMELNVPIKYAFQGDDTYRYRTPNNTGYNGSTYVALLDGRAATTPTLKRVLAVQKGDTITFSAWAKLTGSFATPNAVASSSLSRVQPFVLLGVAATTDDAPGRVEHNGVAPAQTGVSRWLTRLAVGLRFALPSKQPTRLAAAAPVTTAPVATEGTNSPLGTYNAWIKYRVFDESGNVVGTEQTAYLPAGTATSWTQLQLGIRVQQGGTLEVTAASAETSSYTLFDDLRVEQTGGLIVQEQHQYAYGALMPGLSYTVGSMRYRHGYQGQYAEKDAETGFDSFELRLYNSRIGRWMNYDPEGQFNSPYIGMGNNPVSGVDPDGGWSGPPGHWIASSGRYVSPAAKVLSPGLRTFLQTASSAARAANATTLANARMNAHVAVQDGSFVPKRDMRQPASKPLFSLYTIGPQQPTWQNGQEIGMLNGVEIGGYIEGGFALAKLAKITAASAPLLAAAVIKFSKQRQLWTLTAEGASAIRVHGTFGKFYKSISDGLWWSVDKAGHGDSKFKVFRETSKGLEWIHDADEYGTFIVGKHKGDTGKFIPWGKLNASN
jgi:RHS repeat-associated protein